MQFIFEAFAWLPPIEFSSPHNHFYLELYSCLVEWKRIQLVNYESLMRILCLRGGSQGNFEIISVFKIIFSFKLYLGISISFRIIR